LGTWLYQAPYEKSEKITELLNRRELGFIKPLTKNQKKLPNY
jgi:hypothetical protein